MMSMHEQRPKLLLIPPRAALIRIHTDLFTIGSRVKTWLAYYTPDLTNLEKLTVVLEDRRFALHHGFDLKAAARETAKALTFRRHGGASTIDMQFVRTCTGYKQRTFGRKLYEILLAVLIQFRYSKIVILRSYLECAYFGSGLRGSRSAAGAMFKKSAAQLSIDEAAFVAAMLVYPKPLVPGPEWLSRVTRRAEYGKRLYLAHKERYDQLPG